MAKEGNGPPSADDGQAEVKESVKALGLRKQIPNDFDGVANEPRAPRPEKTLLTALACPSGVLMSQPSRSKQTESRCVFRMRNEPLADLAGFLFL